MLQLHKCYIKGLSLLFQLCSIGFYDADLDCGFTMVKREPDTNLIRLLSEQLHCTMAGCNGPLWCNERCSAHPNSVAAFVPSRPVCHEFDILSGQISATCNA